MASAGGAQPSDRQDVASLIVHYHADAYRVARRLVRSDAEAEDLVQTATLNALRRAEHIEDLSHVKAYLLTSVRNLWRNQLRQQGRRKFVGADAAEFVATTDIGPEERALTDLDAALARNAFDALSDTSREILLLRYVEGLSFTDLAGRLAITPVAARQRAHRAREELIGACIEQTARTSVGSCGPIRARLGRYLRGRLTRRARAQISNHLARCASCRECFEELTDLYGHRLSQDNGR
jgi:RNA polymerase sigma-70 factor (ECF subfamily)